MVVMTMIDLFRKSNFFSNTYALFSFYQSYLLRDFHKTEMKRLLRIVRPYTMVSYRRLRNVYELAETTERDSIQGAFVECGVWRGGCAGVMAYVSKKYGSKRAIHLFDSFEGLPDPTEDDGEMALSYMDMVRKGKYSSKYKCDVPLETVQELFFDKLKIPERVVYFHKGWFKNTIPPQNTQIGKIAILRLDADWYESTQICLDHLYDNVVPGGFVILDDYGYWQGCRKAAEEFFIERNISPKLQRVDAGGYYFVKTI
jgi:O-methyltransferase